MINIIINEKFKDSFFENALINISQITLNHFQEATTDITIVIETDQFIQELNKQYRGIDSATDVLSFDIDHIDPETERRYLGDIIISADMIAKNTKTNGVTLMEETRLLVIHGILHLLGYDHASQEEEQAMWAEQDKIIGLIKSESKDQ